MAKAKYTKKGNVKLTLTYEEARELRALYGSMPAPFLREGRLNVETPIYTPLADLLDGGRIETPAIDWDHHDVLRDLFLKATGHAL